MQQTELCKHRSVLYRLKERDKPQRSTTRGLGKPDVFEGAASKVTIRESRDDVANRSVPRWALGADDVGRLDRGTDQQRCARSTGAREASKWSAFTLVMTCRAAALDQVVNAGPGGGPRVRTRFAGVLNFDFSADLWARMKAGADAAQPKRHKNK